MDNFDFMSFNEEKNYDLSQVMLFGDEMMSSQASNQSDYLRDIDLPELVEHDLDCLNEPGSVKCEPTTPPAEDFVADTGVYAPVDEIESYLIQPSPAADTNESGEKFLVFDVNEAVLHIPGNEEYLEMTEPFQAKLIAASDHWIPVPFSSDQTHLVGSEASIPLDAYTQDMENVSDEIPTADSTTDVLVISEEPVINSNDRSRKNAVKITKRSSPHNGIFTDDYLRNVTTKAFNRRIQELGLSKEEERRWKSKRRTLKNRGYAQSCRQKRVGQHQQIDAENLRLRQQLQEERAKRREDLAKMQRLLLLNQQLRARNLELEAAVTNGCLGMQSTMESGLHL